MAIDEFSQEEIGYHVNQLAESGLIRGCRKRNAANSYAKYFVNDITSYGHDFIEKIRNDSTWKKAKSYLKENGVTYSIEAIRAVISGF